MCSTNFTLDDEKTLTTAGSGLTSILNHPGGEVAARGVRAVCIRQAEELTDRLPAIGVRVVFRGYDQEGWQWVDVASSERFQQIIPSPQDPAHAWHLDEGILKPRLILLSQANCPIDSQRCDGFDRAEAFSYLCVLNRAADGDEYMVFATEFPLTPSQQKSVIQRAHLLRDYLQACHSHSNSQARELEQRMLRVEHQLRNPLTAIELFAETLCLQLPPGQLREQAESIQVAIGDLDDRLSLLLANQKSQNLKTRCDLREIALEAIAVLKSHGDAKHLRIQVPEASLSVTVNRSQIKQVFENLLSNAIHFSPQGSVITCDWRAFHQEISVKVSDRGPGLSPKDIASAFLPHYSRRPGGKGLGLAIARGFIREHGGDVWCQSLPQGGAQFCFTLKSLAAN